MTSLLFKAPMVSAILAGTKTQTRRLLPPKAVEAIELLGGGAEGELATAESFTLTWGRQENDAGRLVGPEQWLVNSAEYPEEGCIGIGRLWGPVGGDLWGRETWRPIGAFDSYTTPQLSAMFNEPRQAMAYHLMYRASSDDGMKGWRPAIHMPRWASRITLRVTSVRVERLQDISEADARAEGIHEFDLGEHGSVFGYSPHGTPASMCGDTAVDGFRLLWDSINAKSAPWAANPLVGVIGFERVP